MLNSRVVQLDLMYVIRIESYRILNTNYYYYYLLPITYYQLSIINCQLPNTNYPLQYQLKINIYELRIANNQSPTAICRLPLILDFTMSFLLRMKY